MNYDESKLPAWAQTRLTNLRREVERMKADASPVLYRVEDAPREALYLELFDPDHLARPNLRPVPKFAGVTYVDDHGVPIQLGVEGITRRDGIPTHGGLVLRGRDLILTAPIAVNVVRAVGLSILDLALRERDRSKEA